MVGAFGLVVLAAVVVGIVLIVQTVTNVSGETEPVAAPTETAEPTAAMPTGDAASGACPTEAVSVGADTNEDSYDAGATATLELVVKNNHDAACMIAVGTSQQIFTVRKDGDTVWSSEYCADPEADGDAADVSIVFAQGAEKRSALKWTIEPVDEDCNRSDRAFTGGTYQLVTELGDAESAPVDFEITVPEPEPSDESADEPEHSDESADEPAPAEGDDADGDGAGGDNAGGDGAGGDNAGGDGAGGDNTEGDNAEG